MDKKSLEGLKVLVVDDESVIREILRSELENELLIVDEASDGVQAFEMLMKEDYDFMVCDIRMPHCSGIDLLDKVRESQKIKTKTIMISAFSDLTEKSAQDKGALGLIVKPQEIDKLLQIMLENLD